MRAVALKTVAAALAVVLCGAAAPAQAQDWQSLFDGAADRSAGMRVLVWDPTVTTTTVDPMTGTSTTTTTGGFVVLTVERLLSGVVDFPDGLTRYVAVKAYDPNSPQQPVFTAADLTGGSSVVSQFTGVPIPSPGGMPSSIWLAVAAPSSVGIPWVSWGEGVNSGLNISTSFPEQADVTVSGVSYDVGVSGPLTAAIVGSLSLFFHADDAQ